MHIYTVTGECASEIMGHIRGPEYMACLNDIVVEFRNKAKYDDSETTWSDVYEKLMGILSENDIDPFSG